MLSGYRFELRPDRVCCSSPEWGYSLYAELLSRAPSVFGRESHTEGATPLSQFFAEDCNGALTWTVNLLGQAAEEKLCRTLESLRELRLEKYGVLLSVEHCTVSRIADVEALLAAAAKHDGVHHLCFRTPTAFKSRGQYVNLPTSRLILQSIMKKWNGCVTECPIEDEDGEGMETMAAGLRCSSFQLRSQAFCLKGNTIPGFVGEMTLENRGKGFHRQLLNALLIFTDYSGVGIKTALGMGGVEHAGSNPSTFPTEKNEER